MKLSNCPVERLSLKDFPKIDLLGMGIIPFDLLFTVKKYPMVGIKVDAESFLMQGGGPVPNVTVGMARLGLKSALIAPIGNDPFGEVLLTELRKEKVDTSFIIKKNKPTALASGFIEKSGSRTMVLSREISVTPNDIKLAMLPIPKILHLDGRDMPATMKLARWAKRNKVIVSFDIGSVRNDVSEVFPYVDHLVVADEYAFPFTKTKNVKKAIDKLSQFCKGTIVITEGIKGSTGKEFENDMFVNQKAHKVKNVDTTGAGDCYHSGYLFALLNGKTLAERMQYGSAAAALKCTKAGARSGIPNKKELLAFLNSKKNRYYYV